MDNGLGVFLTKNIDDFRVVLGDYFVVPRVAQKHRSCLGPEVVTIVDFGLVIKESWLSFRVHSI